MPTRKRYHSKNEYDIERNNEHYKRERSFFRTSFFKNLLKVFVLMLIVSALFLCVFAAYLSDYQSCTPEKMTDSVTSDFESIISDNSLDAAAAASELIGECTGLDENLQKPDDFIDYFKGMYDPSRVTCIDVSLPGDTDLTYKLYGACPESSSMDKTSGKYLTSGADSEDIQLGELVLKPSGDESFFHNTRYEISSLSISSLHTYKITAPSDVTVYADGKKLNAEALDDTSADSSNSSTADDESVSVTGSTEDDKTNSETDSTADSESSSDTQTGHFLAAGLPDTAMNTYVIGGRNDPAYIRNVSANGCSVKKTDDDTWDVSYIVSDDDAKDMSSFADRFVHSYSEFATRKNASSSGVKDMIYPGAGLMDSISVYDNSWGQTYTSSEYKDDKVTDICKYADHEYSCRASCTYTIKNGSRSKDYDFDFTLYITDLNGEWKVTDMKTDSQS